MRHPLYLAFASAACAYLAFANARGWSPFYILMPRAFGPAGGASFHHK